MNELCKQDYYRMTGTEYRFGLKSMVQYLFSHQIRYMHWWRKASRRNNIFLRLILRKYAQKYGLEISPDANIGKGLYLGHPYNITVAGGVTLGDNVNLHKGCTIGAENRGRRKGVPTIGNRVSVGIHATVIGNITIGDDVMIAPGSFVNFDVPDHSVVVGNPGKITRREHATEGYISHPV